MEELPITIHGARVLVIGYGRVGRITAQRFQALGAKVSVAARKYADLAWAESLGLGVEQTGRLLGWLCSYDLVINTVPARVLGEAELGDLKPGCLIIDLASKPGGAEEAFG
ncbi:NAD(P)-dependent oxidoreductase [uncultured Pseudoflavonifractor sp.]|uniref:NAD(P)-dependent oxidoreductase n=1 Tax=uncultured Pseudoflavonifractor sp. TaxID=1221379 RepID=UPI0025D8156C|nr:NAD(P)-dependent oxidoreductase [uncultured Pseudoflavonifractor sp.]